MLRSREEVNNTLVAEKVAAENAHQGLVERLEFSEKMRLEAVHRMREAEQHLHKETRAKADNESRGKETLAPSQTL